MLLISMTKPQMRMICYRKKMHKYSHNCIHLLKTLEIRIPLINSNYSKTRIMISMMMISTQKRINNSSNNCHKMKRKRKKTSSKLTAMMMRKLRCSNNRTMTTTLKLRDNSMITSQIYKDLEMVPCHHQVLSLTELMMLLLSIQTLNSKEWMMANLKDQTQFSTEWPGDRKCHNSLTEILLSEQSRMMKKMMITTIII